MTALEELFAELYKDLESSWYEQVYDLDLAATLSPDDRATFVDRLRHEATRGNKRATRTLLRMGERAVVVAALKADLDSEHYAIRMRAYDGLIEAFELRPIIRGPKDEEGLQLYIEHLKIFLSSDMPGFTRLGISEMKRLVDRLAAGDTPESLGIVWEPRTGEDVMEEIRGAMFDLNVPYPLEQIAKLTGGARRMAEIMIAMRNDENDPRVIAALTALDAKWAIACLPKDAIATLTMIVLPADDHDSFEAMSCDERRKQSSGCETYEVRSGLLVDSFFLTATNSDLAVTRARDTRDRDDKHVATAFIDQASLVTVLPTLAELVEAKSEATAQALCARRGAGASPSRVAWALRTGTWPTNGDVAEEAAAFAHHLLRSARAAVDDQCGVCWEYRGRVVVAPEPEVE